MQNVAISILNEPASTELFSLRRRVEQEFRTRFGRIPSMVVAAPGRVNLIGEHVDYNDGFVLPMAIERFTLIAAATVMEPKRPLATIYSAEKKECVQLSIGPSNHPTFENWSRYVEGVIVGFVEKGIEIPAFDAVIGSTIPIGSGLSSSASLEVATATMLETMTGCVLDPHDKGILCQQAEHRFAGVPCGIMDQFSIIFGKPDQLVLIDCRNQQVKNIPLDTSETSIMVVNSHVSHDLASNQYSERRATCASALEKLQRFSWRDVSPRELNAQKSNLTKLEFNRANHVVSEIERTILASDAFRKSDWQRVGELMYASHRSLRDQYEVSCQELDWIVQCASSLGFSKGVYGARLTGGGFGGCVVILAKREQVNAISRHIDSDYHSKTGIHPQIFSSRPSAGARVL